MVSLPSATNSAAAEILGWTLVHSLWQAALVAGGLALALWLVPAQMVRVRSVAAAGSLLLVAGGGATTWFALEADWQSHAACWGSAEQATADPGACAAHGVPIPVSPPGDPGTAEKREAIVTWSWLRSQALPLPDRARPLAHGLTHGVWLPAAVFLWGGLALVSLLRLLLGLRLVSGVIRRSVPPADAACGDVMAALARQMGVRRGVRVRESAEVRAPAVAGLRQPVILLPLGMLATLDRVGLTHVLSHELVHVRRRHYALNLAERLLACLFIGNPFVLAIARQMREEREAACDQRAAGWRGAERRSYAETLLRLEVLRVRDRPALIGVLGEGPLFRRVRRLLEPRTPPGRVDACRTAAAGLASAALLLLLFRLSVSGMALSSWAVMQHDVERRAAPAVAAVSPGPGDGAEILGDTGGT